jgi:filamentous hemagglutinin family protein
MNARSYKTVFSKRLGALVAVGEHATSQGKANGASGPGASGANEGAVSALAGIGYVAALSASFAFVSLAWAAPASNALPTGGTVVQGAASMSQNANQLNIQQTTQRAAINWQSFNIGAAAAVNVAQPNAQAVLLNRVVGQSPSQIFGKLQANGHVILVNPNGVLFGKDGSVNAGGFTASTLNISDANFMAGNMVYERNGSTAGIVNEGKISTEPGGYVALLGATVSNEGSITTKGGSVVMGAGETIKVPVSGTGRIKLELTPAAINASLSNTGSIVTEGGQVYMQALALNRAAAQILQSGSIDTTGEKGGDVHVLADGGTIKVDGRITANSNNGTAGGDIYIGRDKDTNVLAAVGDVSKARLESQGGFVETSGEHLITTGTRVKAAEWLLDPTDITITNSVSGTPYTDPNATGGSYDYTAALTSLILASDIQASLNDGTSVTLATSSGGPDAGNITVATDISKTAGTEATLTLTAHNNIFLNAAISSTFDKLNINLNASGTGGISGNASGIINTNGGVFTLNTTNSNATGILRGNISGTGSVVKTGRGSTTLQGLNTFSGGLLISQGTIVLGNGGVATPDYNRAAGTGSITMGDNNTGTSNIALLLDRGISASQIGLSRDINVTNNGTGTVTLGGVSTATSGSGWTIFNSKINLEKSIIANDSTGDRISFDGQITGSGGITVTGNRLTMGASVQNTFTGDVNIVAGAHLQANSSNSLSKFNNVINHGRLSMWQGNGMTINALSGAGTVGLVFGSSPTNFIIGDNNGTGTFSGVISGPINLIKNGTGTQTFTGNNTYNGQTTVNKGVLSVKANAANATYGTPVYNVAAGATLNFDVANGVSTSAYQNTKFTGAGTITKTGSGTLAWAGSAATFEMAAGSLIDVQAGTFVGGSSTNENWTKNLSSLNVARSATFQGVEAAIRVDALTGEGKIQTGWNGIGGSITTGVNNHQTSGGSAIF